MPATPPSFNQLLSRLKASKAISISTTGYRSATPEYAKESDLLTGAGSKIHGGRWNPVGIATVYISLTPDTAMKETLAHFRYYGIPPQAAMPRTFVATHVRLTKVLDLTDGTIRQRLGISKKRLLSTDWRKQMARRKPALTQVLGRAVHHSGFEAMLVQSAEDRAGQNLVVFPDHLQKSSDFYVLDADQLAP